MIKVNLAPPTTKRPRRAAASGAELNLGLLFGGILAVLVLIIGGWWLSMSLESRRLTAEIENNRRELERLESIIRADRDIGLMIPSEEITLAEEAAAVVRGLQAQPK